MSKAPTNLPPFDPTNVVDLTILADQLKFTYGFKFDRAAELKAAVDKWKTRHPKGIENDDDAATSNDQLAQILLEIDSIHGKAGSIHTFAKAPFLSGGRIVDAVLNAELAGGLREAAAAISGPLESFLKAKRLKAAADAAAQRGAAALAAAAAAEAAAKASGASDRDAAIEAEQAEIEAREAPAPALAESGRIRGELGTVSNMRGTWKVRIVNPNLVPRPYCMPDLAIIEIAMKRSRVGQGEPTISIPGVEFEYHESLSTRR